MAAGSDDLRRLRESLAALVADDVPELLAEARGEARTRVRAILTEVMAEAMLEQARRHGAAAEPARAQAASVAPAPSPTRPSAPSRSADGELGYYIYGVLAADAAVPTGLAGVDPAHPATALVAGDLAALVSRVPLAEFNEERLREHLAEIAWVEAMARRHEEVLEAVAAAATVIPMRLCSIYRDAAGVRAMLEREADPMHDALRRLAARSEWGVKVFSVRIPDPPSPDRGQSQPDSGAAYLEQRGQAQRRRESAAQEGARNAESIHTRLAALAARALVIPLQRPEVSGHEGEMLLNGVYLVDDSRLASFHEAVRTLGEEFGPAGVELVATGPWPPYNFVPDAIGVPA